jgi:hypothetical protein
METHGSETCVQLPRAEVIARLNDRLRKTSTGGTVVVTKAVTNITGFDAVALMAALASYKGFDPDNDPHGERDFGDLTLWNTELLWKIDYYDDDLQFGSDDPADSAITSRVLTVMTASDL